METQPLHYSIAEEIFLQYPSYVRGVVLAHGVHNHPSPEVLIQLLRLEESAIRATLQIETITQHPHIASWRSAFQSAGIKAGKFRPSMESMIRRILKKQDIPSINTLVDIGNIISLRHMVPVGGHAIDQLQGNLSLRYATGQESFIPFGSNKEENPEPGEIIFVENNTVLTRRWTWRQANHSLTLPSTTAIEFNIDGLAPLSIDAVSKIGEETIELIKTFCSGKIAYKVLTKDSPQITIIE